MISATHLNFKLDKGQIKSYPDINAIKDQFLFHELKQVHGTKIIEINSKTLSTSHEEADGFVFFYDNNRGNKTKASLPLAIKTADCIPLTVLGKKGLVHLHAGWRGIQQKIHLQKSLIDIEPYEFFFGPSIQKCCYEVGEEFQDHFPLFSLFSQSKNGSTHFQFDLVQYAIHEIKEKFGPMEIINPGICTCCGKNSSLKLQSFRRDKNKQRNFNIYFFPSMN